MSAAASAWDAKSLRELEHNYLDERSSRWMYERLADADREPERAALRPGAPPLRPPIGPPPSSARPARQAATRSSTSSHRAPAAAGWPSAASRATDARARASGAPPDCSMRAAYLSMSRISWPGAGAR